MLALLFLVLALLFVTAGVHLAHVRRNGRSAPLLLSLGCVSTRWLITHRGEQQ